MVAKVVIKKDIVEKLSICNTRHAIIKVSVAMPSALKNLLPYSIILSLFTAMEVTIQIHMPPMTFPLSTPQDRQPLPCGECSFLSR